MKDEKSYRGYKREAKLELSRAQPDVEKLRSMAKAIGLSRWKPAWEDLAASLAIDIEQAADAVEAEQIKRREARGLLGGLAARPAESQ